MRVLIVSVGSFGDLLPFLAIAEGLVERGHRVTIATNSEYEPHVHRRGYAFRPILRSDDQFGAASDPQLWDRNYAWSIAWESLFAPSVLQTYEVVAEHSRSGHGVVLASWLCFGARLAQEKLGVPVCSAYLAPEALLACDVSGQRTPRWRSVPDDALFGPRLNTYRAALGLAPVEAICSHWMHSPLRGLALFPEWFYAARPFWPTQVISTGFPLFDGTLMPLSLPSLQEFLQQGAPPIVFTPGTGMRQARAFFDASIAACASLGRRAILLSPHKAAIPHPLPSWALHQDYLPLTRVLGHSAALVHHGGIGTCAQAIRAGTPQLLTPMAFDQFDNAEHVQALGMGLALPMAQYRAPLAAEMLERLVPEDSDLRAGCAMYAEKLRADNPVPRICEHLEALA